jgi:hypothetical protein
MFLLLLAEMALIIQEALREPEGSYFILLHQDFHHLTQQNLACHLPVWVLMLSMLNRFSPFESDCVASRVAKLLIWAIFVSGGDMARSSFEFAAADSRSG